MQTTRRFEWPRPNDAWQIDATHLGARPTDAPCGVIEDTSTTTRVPSSPHTWTRPHSQRRLERIHHRSTGMGTAGSGDERQRQLLHRPAGQARRCRLRADAAKPRHHPDLLTSCPSANLRQARTITPNHQNLAPNSPGHSLRPTPRPARPLARPLQPGPPTPRFGRADTARTLARQPTAWSCDRTAVRAQAVNATPRPILVMVS